MQNEIRVQLRRDTRERWVAANAVPEYGEAALIYSTKRDSQNNPIMEADGITPMHDKLIAMVMGDGALTVMQLFDAQAFYHVEQRTFNSVANGSAGIDRNLNDLTKADATLPYTDLNSALYDFFHPYGLPAFTSFTPASYVDVEVGIEHALNRTYTWVSSMPQNVQPGSVSIDADFKDGAAASTETLNVAGALNAVSPSGGLIVNNKPTRRGTKIGATLTLRLSGRNNKGANMAPRAATLNWKGRAAWFMHPNSEWLVPGMSAKPGETQGTTLNNDVTLAAYLQDALNNVNPNAFTKGNALVSAGHQFGKLEVDGGVSGGRYYMLYPKDVRATGFRVDNASFNQPYAPVVTREIVLPRNGVNVTYVLAALDLAIFQKLPIIAL